MVRKLRFAQNRGLAGQNDKIRGSEGEKIVLKKVKLIVSINLI
jgi:hypothetical protein